SERRERLSELESERRTMIFYEAPHKLRGTLDDLLRHFGDRQIALCRELTKLNEEVCRTTIAKAVEIYADRDPRGEYVLIVEGRSESAASTSYPEDPTEHVNMLIDIGMSKMDAIKAAAKQRGVAKNEIYSLVMKKDGE
ncbi:MAG: 16S rRNA (cytidine(1402)-2'-O)-methyltransferase, partial [Clostridia bacterium]|nr:16S rRNA (cytidine(1402)-2'-O)-methyltransferase [Clostridia bacterium]